MSWLKLSWKNIWHRPLSAFLSIILLAFGSALIIMLLHSTRQLENHFTRDIKDIDLVVGAKGSPLQLILSSVYHIDAPTGNISLSEFKKLAANPLVDKAIPLAYGDNFQGYRIVGTNRDYLNLYHSKAANGRLWDNVNEVVLGSETAEKTGLKPGDEFNGQHGLQAEADAHDHPYTVIGILKPTGSVLDKLILTSLESVWEVHGHSEEHTEGEDHIHDDKEITAGLILFRSPMAVMSIPRWVNEKTNMQAALPAIEINRLFTLLSPAIYGLQILALLIIVLSAVSVFISLLQSLRARQYELALLRSLGASPSYLFLILLMEGVIISILGFLLGWAGSKFGMYLVHILTHQRSGYGLEIWAFDPAELWLLGGIILLGILASAIPSWRAYRLNISKALSHE